MGLDLDKIVRDAQNAQPTIKLEPIVHTLAGCQIMVKEEQHPITGQTIRTLTALHPSGHQYDIAMPVDVAAQVGRALSLRRQTEAEKNGS